MRVDGRKQTRSPGLETAAVPEQVAAIAPKVSAVAPDIAPVAPDVREVPADIAASAESQITAQIAKILPQIGTVTTEVEPVRSDVPSVGPNVGSMSPPTGRGSGRSQSDDHRSGGESDDGCANHGMSPVSKAQRPLSSLALNRGWPGDLCRVHHCEDWMAELDVASAAESSSRSDGRSGYSPLVEHHHLGHEGVDVADVREPACTRQRAKIFLEIARVIGLVKILREQLEHAVVVRLVADLQGVDDDQPAAGLEHARALAQERAAHLRRQFMEHEDAGDGVLALVGERDRLPVRDHEVDPAPALEVTSRLCQIGLRHVDPDDRQPRPGLLAKIEEAAGAAADVEQAQTALIAPGEQLVERHQRLPPGRIGRAFEQHLDLRVVTPRGLLRHPAAGLEMEILQVVNRTLAAAVLVQHFPPMAVLAAAVHLRQVLEEQARALDEDRPGAVVI